MTSTSSIVGEVGRVAAGEIDRALRTLALRRAGLDAEEARWLRLAEEQKVWRELGYVHAHEYLEEVFGYAPRTATERLRVAHDLGELPELERALEAGEINYSIVRELTRVATPDTVDRWLSAACGRNLRDVESMVSGRRKGDDPDSAPDPKLVKHGVWLDLDAESFALFRQARAAFEDELGENLDDKSFVVEVARRMLASGDGASDTRRPARMIHISTCNECQRSWQDGAGVRVELGPAAVELAQCDAIVVDEDAGTRARSAIALATRRRVLERAAHRCEVPGCRSARNLDLHHIRPRAKGGGHEPWNLLVLCGGHHRLHHKGLLSIAGRTPDALELVRGGRRLGSTVERPTKPVASPHHRATEGNALCLPAESSLAVEYAADARMALTQMGYKPAIAKRAVERARAHLGMDVDLTRLILDALRHCV